MLTHFPIGRIPMLTVLAISSAPAGFLPPVIMHLAARADELPDGNPKNACIAGACVLTALLIFSVWRFYATLRLVKRTPDGDTMFGAGRREWLAWLWGSFGLGMVLGLKYLLGL